MISRIRGLSLIAILLVTGAARAQEATPAITVWTSSLDGLLSQSKILFNQLGLNDTAEKFDELVSAKLGAKRFAGIDASRPIGAFLQFDPDPSGALLIPITGERDFLDLLERLDMKAAKENEGTYRLAAPLPIAAYLKFSGKHAWITLLNKTAFASKIDPATVFPAQPKLLAGRVRIDMIPKDARQLLISHVEDALQDSFKKSTAGSTPAQKAFAEACNQAIARLFVQFLEEGKELSIDVAFSAVSHGLHSSMSLTPKPGTPLAKLIADAGRRNTVFAKSSPKDPVGFTAHVNTALPDSVAAAFSKLVEDSFKEAADGMQNPAKKKQTLELLDAVMPTLKAGELDAIVAFAGTKADKLAVVAGLKIAQGDRVGTLFKTLAAEARTQMSDADKAKIVLDADSAGPAKIHRFALNADKGTLRETRDILGESILSLAFRPDALVVGIGQGSGEAIKNAAQPSSPAASPMAQVRVHISKLAPIFAPTPKLRAVANEIFHDIVRDPFDDYCGLSVTGGDKLELDLSIGTQVLRYFAATREERAAAPKK